MTTEVDINMASSKVATIAQDLRDTPDDICSQATDEDISSLTEKAEAVKKAVTKIRKAVAEARSKLKGTFVLFGT